MAEDEATETTETTGTTKTAMIAMRRGNALVSTSIAIQGGGLNIALLVVEGVIVPIFLPWKVPKRNVCGYDKKALPLHNERV